MDEYLTQVQLKPKETILLSEEVSFYNSYTASERRLRTSPAQPHHINVRRWEKYEGWLFLTNKRILFVAKVGVFRRSTKVIYSLSMKRITDLKVSKVLFRGLVIQITTGQERKRIAQFSVHDVEQWHQAIRKTMPQ